MGELQRVPEGFRDPAPPFHCRYRPVPSAATSCVLCTEPGAGHHGDTQPAALDSICPFSRALGTSPLTSPSVTLLPREVLRCPTCVTAGALPGQFACRTAWEARAGIQSPRAPGAARLLGKLLSPLTAQISAGWSSAELPVAIQPVTPECFPPPGDKGKEAGLALVKCGADSFTASLGRGAERKSVRFNLC